MERLTPRVRVVWMAAAAARAAVLGGLAVGVVLALYLADVVTTARSLVVPGVVALVALVGVASIAVAWRRYGVWRFDLREDALYIERGVFTRVTTVVPYVRVQHVDSRRSAVERAIGLATLVVYTAGSRSADVVIPGLTPSRAEALREQLRRLAIESEGEDAV